MTDTETNNWIRNTAHNIYVEAAALAINELREEDLSSSTLKTMANNAFLAASVWYRLVLDPNKTENLPTSSPFSEKQGVWD